VLASQADREKSYRFESGSSRIATLTAEMVAEREDELLSMGESVLILAALSTLVVSILSITVF
jgi:hypothetical protein